MTDAGAQLYEDLMRFKPEGMTPNAWAVQAGVSRTIWSDLRRHGNPSRRTLERLLSTAGSSLAEFEALRIGEPAPAGTEAFANVADAHNAGWRGAVLPPVPLLETRAAGEWGEPGSGIDLIELHVDSRQGHVARPASMADDREAYAFTMPVNGMWPRFRPCRQLLVSPAASVSVGDDVVVRLGVPSGPDRLVKLLIGELVRQAASVIELRQFNPDVTFRIGAADVAALHKVVGEAF